jgi:hypothetical protein
MTGGVLTAAALGGPFGLAAIGGLAAVAAGEYLGAQRTQRGGHVDPEQVGRPSGAVLQAVERLGREERETPETGGEPGAAAPPEVDRREAGRPEPDPLEPRPSDATQGRAGPG